jgi:TrpR-related protein YerC/YecD
MVLAFGPGDSGSLSTFVQGMNAGGGWMNDKLRDESVDLLFDAVLSLKNRQDCYSFFEDICTVSELKSLAMRLHVAILLQQGMKYSDICERTGASTATISRVNRSLFYGADGYLTVLDRLRKDGRIQGP